MKMNYRKFVAFCFFVLAPSIITKAQEEKDLYKSFERAQGSRLFIRLIGGNAFWGPGSFTGVNRTPDGKFQTSKQHFGEGRRVGIGLGCVLGANLNLGINVMLHKGNKLTLAESMENEFDTIGIQYKRTTNSDVTTSYTHTILNFIPTITFKTISTSNYYLYTRVGPIVALPLELNTSNRAIYSSRAQNISPQAEYDYTNSQMTYYDGYYSKDATFGFQTALGVEVRITNNVRFFTELEASSLVLKPKRLVYTTYNYTSTTTQNLPLPAKQVASSSDSKPRHYFYEKSGSVKTVEMLDRTEIYTSQIKMPTNSLSLNAGIVVKLK
jgi:hypothetical protein